ncbi:MAG: zinc-binding dehydrogenase [Planctomycetota bacterium]|jgi:6-hydroxycyclohex-1-ene-1-carbonyl-CoA dehydrogenase
MKAAVFQEVKKPLAVQECPIPEPGAGEILVKVAACGVCHTDLHYIDHGVPTVKKPPLILGHEISGTVAGLGEGVANLKEGDKVLLPAVLTCGQCEACRRGRENVCVNMVMFGNHVDGGYAEYVKAPAKDVFPLPDTLPLEDAAIIADAVSTPFHAVKNRGEVRPGDRVAVFGCGGVGINTVQVAAAAGATVWAVDKVEEKLAMAKELGAEATVDASAVEDPAKAIRKMTGGGVDVAFEVIGNPGVIANAFSSIRGGGRLVVVGYTHKDVGLNAGRIMFREMEVVGSLGCRPVDYPPIIEMARTGKIRVTPLISGRYSLDKINDAFDTLRSGKGFRYLITP